MYQGLEPYGLTLVGGTTGDRRGARTLAGRWCIVLWE